MPPRGKHASLSLYLIGKGEGCGIIRLMEMSEEIEKRAEAMRVLFNSLGRLVAESPSPPNIGEALLKNAEGARENFRLLEERDSKRKALEGERDDAIERIALIETEIDDKEEIAKENLMKLGAVIYERSLLSLSDRSLFPKAYERADAEREIEKKLDVGSTFEKAIASLRIKSFQAGSAASFLLFGEESILEGTYVFLASGEANTFASIALEAREEVSKLKVERDGLEKRLDALNSLIRETGPSVKTEELERRRRELFEAYVSYGNYLFGRGDEWVGPATPPPILDILQALLSAEGELDELHAEAGIREGEGRAESIMIMIREEEEKLNILEEERARIERQMNEIRKEVGRLQALLNKSENL